VATEVKEGKQTACRGYDEKSYLGARPPKLPLNGNVY
jgi:hypothetical protein